MSFLFGDKNAKLANDLVTAGRVPSQLVEKTKSELIELFKKSPPKDGQKLIKLINHPCEAEQLEKQYGDFMRKWNSEEFNDPDATDPNGVPVKQALVEKTAHHLSLIIGLGYEDAFRDNLIFDKSGNPIDIVEGQGIQRFQRCKEFLTSSQNLQRLSSSAESDPYKGSQQGLGRKRKTRKHSKKAKKTHRRKH